MNEVWYYMVAEIAALKWRAFIYGPEAWLVIPGILGMIGLVCVFLLCWKK